MTQVAAGHPIRLGTRGSKLARWQAEWVAAQLQNHGVAVEIIEISTQGDRDQSSPIEQLGEVGLFTKELQRALLRDEIDLAVHSLKDLPTTPIEELSLGAIPPRALANDALVSNLASTLDDLPQGARVGTGSTRRRAQLLRLRPDLLLEEVRGNVDTRLRKLDAGGYEALILAAAGLTRLGFQERIRQTLPVDLLVPAPGQGALGVECRAGDEPTRRVLASLHDPSTAACVTAERALLAEVEGGCLAALGAHATLDGDRLTLAAIVLSPDGRQHLTARGEAHPERAGWLGKSLAQELLASGAGELLVRR